MATPISEQIAVVVRNRLAAISTGSGYETTTTGAIRPTKQGVTQPKDYQIIVKEGDKTENAELSHPGNPMAVAWNFPFLIRGIVRPSDTNTTALGTIKNTFEADVDKSLRSVANWHTFGGLAINATITQAVQEDSDDVGAGVFVMTLNVIYRVSETDPYTVRA